MTSSECSIIPNVIKHCLHVLYLPQRGYHDYITITAPRMNVKFIYCVKCGMNELRTELQRLYQHPNHFVCSRLLRALHTQVYRSKLSKVSTIKVSQHLTIWLWPPERRPGSTTCTWMWRWTRTSCTEPPCSGTRRPDTTSTGASSGTGLSVHR